MNKNSKIYIAGHTGMVGSAILRKLKSENYTNLILKSRKELDLINQEAVENFLNTEKPEYVFLAAAKVGGIYANESKSADFIYENLMIQNNLITSSFNNNVKKLLFLGSSCIYPKKSNLPIAEDQILTGPLEETNKSYAIAKIAGLQLCQSFRKQYGFNAISIMPTNLYGPNDNFSLETSHVLPALIRKFHEAKANNSDSVTCWGDGSPLREFLYVDDLADASLFCMKNYDESEPVNIGTGKEISIQELSELIKSITGFKGNILWDESKPNGTHSKLLNVSKINNLGWVSKIDLEDGIKKTYKWFTKNLTLIKT
jgi:GDP-L-fucose synthase